MLGSQIRYQEYMSDIFGTMFQIISGTTKTVSGKQTLERNVPHTAHRNVPDNSLLLGTLFLLVFPVIINNTLLIRQCYDNARHLIILNLQLS